MAAKPTEPAKGADAAHPPAAAAAGAAGDKEKNAAPEASAKPAGGGLAAFIPLIAAIVIAPALSWAVGQFVLMPQLKKQLSAPIDPHAAATPAEHGAAAEEPAAEGGHGKEEKGGKGKKGEGAANGATYEFENVVVNLAGTMGTRYLKTAFLVTGTDKSLRAAFEANKPKMVDITINVLSSLSLADLEEAGAKNLIREKLIGAYNQAFGKRLVDQVYFSDFVVQ
jgi:flagellar FliL protein